MKRILRMLLFPLVFTIATLFYLPLMLIFFITDIAMWLYSSLDERMCPYIDRCYNEFLQKIKP